MWHPSPPPLPLPQLNLFRYILLRCVGNYEDLGWVFLPYKLACEGKQIQLFWQQLELSSMLWEHWQQLCSKQGVKIASIEKLTNHLRGKQFACGPAILSHSNWRASIWALPPLPPLKWALWGTFFWADFSQCVKSPFWRYISTTKNPGKPHYPPFTKGNAHLNFNLVRV